MKTAIFSEAPGEKPRIWQPTAVQHLYRHQNGRYYVRTFAAGKEKWASLRTKLISVAKNRMKEHLDAADRIRSSGATVVAEGRLLFSDATTEYLRRLDAASIRPNTKAFRQAGLKLIAKSWPELPAMNVRRITSRMVEEWLVRFKAAAKPHTPPGAKSPSRNSTGASTTTIKCALDAIRHVLDVAVECGHLAANPARNSSLVTSAKKVLKLARREKAARGPIRIPSRDEFRQIVAAIQSAGVAECKAAAEYVQFIAFCGARKTEAINVLWSDVDFRRAQIHLRITKNGEARFVPMIDDLRNLLLKMKAERENCLPEEAILRIKEAQGFINSACRQSEVPRFTTHALRHLFGTACLESGVDVRTVAAWLGHKDNGALLLKIYSHVRQSHETEMARRVQFT